MLNHYNNLLFLRYAVAIDTRYKGYLYDIQKIKGLYK